MALNFESHDRSEKNFGIGSPEPGALVLAGAERGCVSRRTRSEQKFAAGVTSTRRYKAGVHQKTPSRPLSTLFRLPSIPRSTCCRPWSRRLNEVEMRIANLARKLFVRCTLVEGTYGFEGRGRWAGKNNISNASPSLSLDRILELQFTRDGRWTTR